MNKSNNDTADGSTMELATIVVVSAAAGLCSLLTIFGNFVVILAFITNRSLRNFSNYLILNLAISDLIIGLFSMNIYIVYNISGTWTMGKGMCNAWLTVDYVVSNTSVMNLLVICIDRYLAITSPVKYKRRCTPNVAALVISIAWAISFLLWAPAILLWEFISPDSNPLDEGGCSIPFMDSSPAVTIITALGAFYVPAAAMCALYWRVIVKIEKQTSSVSSMISRATKAISSRYTSPFKRKQVQVTLEKDGNDQLVKETIADKENNGQDGMEKNNSKAEKSENELKEKEALSKPDGNKFADLLRKASYRYGQKLDVQTSNRDSGSDKNSTTHLLKKEDTKSSSGPEISDTPHSVTRSEEESFKKTEKVPDIQSPSVSIKRSTAKIKRYAKLKKHSSNLSFIHKNTENRLNREKRATNLLKSILICFICLWLPYNVIVIVSGICGRNCVISDNLWILSYWLCYLNSTANPFCYGYCNENFQRTFKALLTTKWWTPTGRRKLRCQVGGRNSLRTM